MSENKTKKIAYPSMKTKEGEYLIDQIEVLRYLGFPKFQVEMIITEALTGTMYSVVSDS